jgi:very-short-patch-repair endonuclease
LWAEAKKGKSDIIKSIVQLILTIGKARTFDKELPPTLLGAFDYYQMAFVPYNDIQEVFYQNDFNWNVAPSNYETKEFKQLHDKVKSTIENKSLVFDFQKDKKELKEFIRINFIAGKSDTSKIQIDKNNFLVIYNKWLTTVKPTILINWKVAKKNGIIDGDFYLADLLSDNNQTLKQKLSVLLKTDHYELERKLDEMGMFDSKRANFNDNQKAYNQFWNRYLRPPRQEYWDYIVERRDLLVPQDVRERKGSFFTPQIWVELSQKYLTDVLGEDWQDEYYIWDCACGTGNLLTGLTNKYNIWASTLDRQDVDVIKDRIKNGANLLEDHCFEFDFLNDEFTKLPKGLQEIINNPEKRKKLVIYINPPYAEATSATTVSGTGKNKAGVSTENKPNATYREKIGNATNEIFALFMARIYDQIQGSKLAQFSKIKFAQGSNFAKFRDFFLAKYLGGFAVPADTFDNVKGQFPITFTIWDTDQKDKIQIVNCDVYDSKNTNIGVKIFDGEISQSINKWIKIFDDKENDNIGYLANPSPDFQHSNQMYISVKKGIEHFNFYCINAKNLIPAAIYLSVRQVFKATWLNDRDQFLYPNDGWKVDKEFQSDCLAYTIFHGQNRITSKAGVNHWIPFTESQVEAREKFESNFLVRFLNGRLGEKPLSKPQSAISDSPLKGANPCDFLPSKGGVQRTESFDQLSATTETPVGLANSNLLGVKTPVNLSVASPLKGAIPPLKGVSRSDGGFNALDGVASQTTRVFTKFTDIGFKFPANKDLSHRAKDMAKNMTKSEQLIWFNILDSKKTGYKWTKQRVIDNYIVDFCCQELGLVIEIDGDTHDNKQEYDKIRTHLLNNFGLEVVRYSNDSVYNNLEGIKLDLENRIRERINKLSEEYSQNEEIENKDNALFEDIQESFVPNSPLEFSIEAQEVFEAGLKLWKYYHNYPETNLQRVEIPVSFASSPLKEANPHKGFNSLEGVSRSDGGFILRGIINPNASLYDIREYFQGRNAKGNMNMTSSDETYNQLIKNLREKLEILATKIQPKVYEYGFLK